MSTKALRDKLVSIAKAENGVREHGGPNTGTRVKLYQGATWYSGTGWPWCAAFVAWCVREWGRTTPEVLSLLGCNTPEQWETFRFKDPGAFKAEDWARARFGAGVQLFTGRDTVDGMTLHTGDIVIFSFSHIGIIDTDSTARREIYTIEGNTNAAGSANGDGVYLKTRPRNNTIRSIVRILP